MKIEENIKEKDFSEYLSKEGYKCKKLTESNANSIKDRLGFNFEVCKGMPDFFVYNKKDKFLCEFKSQLDSWQPHQIEWTLNNSHIPIVLALVLSKTKVKEDILELDSTFEEDQKLIRLVWKEKNKVLDEYVSKHQELIGFTLFQNPLGGYLGEIPQEVSLIWKEIDKKYFEKEAIEGAREVF